MKDKNNYDNSWMGGMFISFVVVCILLTVVFCMLVSCSTVKYVDRVEYRDSLVYQKEVKDSVVFIPLPLESNQVIVHMGDTSNLETSLAMSTSFVGSDGLLHHSLENKKDKFQVVVSIPSVTIRHGVESKQTHTITQYIEKPLSWWQKFRIEAFWWLLAGLVIALVGLVIALVWIFRKPIKTLLRI